MSQTILLCMCGSLVVIRLVIQQ